MPADTTAGFVDSNVWLYAFVQSDEPAKSATAQQLIQSISPVVSTQVINEVCVNLLRKAAFTEAQITKLISSYYAKYRVVELDESTLVLASELRQRYSLSFWDGLIVASARRAGCTMPYSEDMNHGLRIDGTLIIANPFIATV